MNGVKCTLRTCSDVCVCIRCHNRRFHLIHIAMAIVWFDITIKSVIDRAVWFFFWRYTFLEHLFFLWNLEPQPCRDLKNSASSYKYSKKAIALFYTSRWTKYRTIVVLAPSAHVRHYFICPPTRFHHLLRSVFIAFGAFLPLCCALTPNNWTLLFTLWRANKKHLDNACVARLWNSYTPEFGSALRFCQPANERSRYSMHTSNCYIPSGVSFWTR